MLKWVRFVAPLHSWDDDDALPIDLFKTLSDYLVFTAEDTDVLFLHSDALQWVSSLLLMLLLSGRTSSRSAAPRRSMCINKLGFTAVFIAPKETNNLRGEGFYFIAPTQSVN